MAKYKYIGKSKSSPSKGSDNLPCVTLKYGQIIYGQIEDIILPPFQAYRGLSMPPDRENVGCGNYPINESDLIEIQEASIVGIKFDKNKAVLIGLAILGMALFYKLVIKDK